MNSNPDSERGVLVERNLIRQKKEREIAEEKFKKTYCISDKIYEECLKPKKSNTCTLCITTRNIQSRKSSVNPTYQDFG